MGSSMMAVSRNFWLRRKRDRVGSLPTYRWHDNEAEVGILGHRGLSTTNHSSLRPPALKHVDCWTCGRANHFHQTILRTSRVHISLVMDEQLAQFVKAVSM